MSQFNFSEQLRSGNQHEAQLDEIFRRISNYEIFPATPGSDNITVAWLVWDKTWGWQKLGIDCPFKFIPGWR